jgi:hypothetical protein
MGQLSNGSATVQLEPGFAALVKTDDYHVFLTPNGDTRGLYVSNRSQSGFTVHEAQAGTGSVSFSYRLVARRKDVTGARLEHVEEPPAIQLLKLSPPETPTVPDLPKQSETPEAGNRELSSREGSRFASNLSSYNGTGTGVLGSSTSSAGSMDRTTRPPAAKQPSRGATPAVDEA